MNVMTTLRRMDSVIDVIQRIAELQLSYNSSNTEEMQERGRLIRKILPQELSFYMDSFRKSLGRFSHDLSIQGKDGQGLKTEAPWVRLHSQSLSPSATKGFYVVLHFSIDGLRCYVTVGCGATTWDNEVGHFVRTPEDDLDKQVLWALQEIENTETPTDLFPDHIDLGSEVALPKAFERATVLAKCFDVKSMVEEDFIASIKSALKFLAIVYDAYSQGKPLSSNEVHESDIETVVNPMRKTSGSRQGYGLSGPDRKAVELRAMSVVRDYVESLGFHCKDTSNNRPYDFLISKNGKDIKVEVKGTTNRSPDSVLMTANEVALHTQEAGRTVLAIVHSINLIQRGENARAEDGKLEYLDGWNIGDWTTEPTAFVVKRPIS